MIGANTSEINSACIQGNQPERNANQRIVMNADSPVLPWQYHQSVVTKSEPMDEQTAYHAESNNNPYNIANPTNNPYTPTNPINSPYTPANPPNRNPYYLAANGGREFQSAATPHFMYNHLPLTPPESEPMVSPKNQGPSPSPPSASPTTTKPSVIESPSTASSVVKQEPDYNHSSDDSNKSMDYWSPHNGNGPLQNLEKTMENTVQAAQHRNSGNSGSSGDDVEARKSSDDDIRKPKVNSNGKMKVWKCKQCGFVAQTKVESWDHAKTHIKPEKLLRCNTCPFVTEFKHHLEYHLLNHTGKKPFKCDQCEYRCVNKSMLSSHSKCHSDVHQYRCADCNYVSKYCHSLKLHLRKYGHSPSKVLNPDGTENPYPIIDVYGTRRGPKMKTPQRHQRQQPYTDPQDPQPSTSQASMPFTLPPQFMFPPPHLFSALPFVNRFNTSVLQDTLMLENLHRIMREHQAELQNTQLQEAQRSPEPSSPVPDPDVLDLSKPGPSKGKSRRKGRAYRFEPMAPESSGDESESTTTMFSNVEVVQNDESISEEVNNNLDETEATNAANTENNNKANGFECKPCGITFADHVLYTIHMGFHGFNDPFTCNVCGLQCKDRVDFYLHILRPRHMHRDAA